MNGLRDGKGIYKYQDKVSKYEGMFSQDEYNGNGFLSLKNGNTYKGDFRNGGFHGTGEYITAGFTYIGQFSQGNIDGKGTIKYRNDEFYQGNFQLNKKHGYGEYHYSDGTVYCGQWLEDKKNGKGKIKRPNGDFLEAEFCNGQVHGEIKAKEDKWNYVA